MFKSYKEIAEEIGLDLENVKPPVQKKVWYAYNEGKVIICNSREEAKKYKLYETVIDPTTNEEILKYWDDRRELETEAAQLFKDGIRSEYSDLSDNLYNLCYTAAQDRVQSSSDYEEIPDNMKYFVMFAKSAINADKNVSDTKSKFDSEEVEDDSTTEVREQDEDSFFSDDINQVTHKQN